MLTSHLHYEDIFPTDAAPAPYLDITTVCLDLPNFLPPKAICQTKVLPNYCHL